MEFLKGWRHLLFIQLSGVTAALASAIFDDIVLQEIPLQLKTFFSRKPAGNKSNIHPMLFLHYYLHQKALCMHYVNILAVLIKRREKGIYI